MLGAGCLLSEVIFSRGAKRVKWERVEETKRAQSYSQYEIMSRRVKKLFFSSSYLY